jgi:hypothetical protein
LIFRRSSLFAIDFDCFGLRFGGSYLVARTR